MIFFGYVKNYSTIGQEEILGAVQTTFTFASYSEAIEPE